MTEFRIERDSMGEVQVPARAYFGAQTQRAKENFPVSGWQLPEELVNALGLVKLANLHSPFEKGLFEPLFKEIEEYLGTVDDKAM